MEDEEDLLGLITLGEEDIVVEEVETLELGDDVDQEVLWLVSEEADTLDQEPLDWYSKARHLYLIS